MTLFCSKFGIVHAVALATFVSLAPVSFCEEGPAPAPTRQSNTKTEEKTTRDPTQPSEKMKQALKAAEKPVELPATKTAPVKVPEIGLKALVQNAEGKTRAIIAVNKELFEVDEGTELSVKGAEGGTLLLVVRKLSAQGALIEIPTLKQTLNLH